MPASATYEITWEDGSSKVVQCVVDPDAEGYRKFGHGLGIDIDHAAYEGVLHVPDFAERVEGFRVVDDYFKEVFSEATGLDYLSVEFFERVE